ncbi:hypothetical protein HY633_02125 [Candidatus Uhrbacteria bacterium]|nr:hypothetical protein [Candidatus Uhrbacteria bacterium]
MRTLQELMSRVLKGTIPYEIELERETRYLVTPGNAYAYAWTNHVIDTYDASGRVRVRIKNGRPRLSFKVPLLSLDTDTSKSCLRLEFKPCNWRQERHILLIRDVILAEAKAQTMEKWGARMRLASGKEVWLNRNAAGKWWFEVDDDFAFAAPPGFEITGVEKSDVRAPS